MPSPKFQFQQFLGKARKSVFGKNILVVMTGTAISQVIGFSLSPLISRLFTPSDFGVFGSFSSVAGIIAAGVTLQYTQAIMLPKEKSDAINLFFVSCLCTLAVGMLCLVTCLVIPNTMRELMKTDNSWMFALLVIATITTGLNSSVSAWCVRAKAFKQTSTSQVVRSVSSNGMQIGFGFFKVGAPGLIASSVLADVVSSVNLARITIPDIKAHWPSVTWERMKTVAREYKDFPMYSATQNVLNSLSNGLPVLLLTHYYGIAVTGAYTFGIRLLQAPMSFISGSLRQVLFQKACETQHNGDSLVSLYIKITTGLFAIAIIPVFVCVTWAPQLSVWIFGMQWQLAGEFARSLILWMMFAFCNLPAVLFARLIRIQRTIFFFDLGMLVARTLALVLGGIYLTASQTILLFASVGAAMNLFLIVLVGYAVMKKEGKLGIGHVLDGLVN